MPFTYLVLLLPLLAASPARTIVGLKWPTCAQPTTTVLTGDSLQLLATIGPANDTFYQSPTTQPPFNATMCNATDTSLASGAATPALCVIPSASPSANTYATIATQFSPVNQPQPGTLLTISYRLQFLEGIDSFNLFGYGFQAITFFGHFDSEYRPYGPSFGFSTGSLPAYQNYPDWDSIWPLGVVWPLTTSAFCDSLIQFNEYSATPCKFYTFLNSSDPIREGWFQVNVTFNISVTLNASTPVSNYVTAASVVMSNGTVLFNLTDLTPRWSAEPTNDTTLMSSPVIGIVSARSPFKMWNLYASATLPGCPPTTTTTTTTTTLFLPTPVPLTPTTWATQVSAVPASSPLSAQTLPLSTTPGTIGSAPVGTTSATVTTTNTDESNATTSTGEQMMLVTSPQFRPTEDDDTPLFIALLVVFGSICCIVLTCTVFRKRIRRSAPVKALYSAVPGPLRHVVCYPCRKLDYELGTTYEEGELAFGVRACVECAVPGETCVCRESGRRSSARVRAPLFAVIVGASGAQIEIAATNTQLSSLSCSR